MAARRVGPSPGGDDLGKFVRQLDPLERIGLVAREPNPSDAGLALVVLPPVGGRPARPQPA